MKYRFLDVKSTYTELKEDLDAAIQEVMSSGIYIGGAEINKFETMFSDYCGSRNCIGLGNGLEALEMPLRAWGIRPGDEVIVPAHTFIATWLAVAKTGAQPIPVDADPATMNMDVEAALAAVTPRTKAIIPVHLYGQPVPMARLMAEAGRRGIRVLEDAAQAHGARDGGARAGSLGDAAAFSFYPGKNLGAFGDGGALVTADDALAHQVRMLSNYGAETKYHHQLKGGNSRLDPLQAACLSVKLARLDQWNARRKAVGELYLAALADQPDLILPGVAAGTDPVWHLFVIRHPRRDALQVALAAAGVPAALHYPVPIHQSGAFAQSHGALSLPVTEEICRTCLSLPIGPHLSTTDAAEIAEILRGCLRKL